MDTIRENGFVMVESPLYPLDFVSSDYVLSGNLKNYLRGSRYGSMNDVLEAAEGYFRSQDA